MFSQTDKHSQAKGRILKVRGFHMQVDILINEVLQLFLMLLVVFSQIKITMEWKCI